MFVFSVSTQRWRHFFDLPLPLSRTSTATTHTGNIIAIGGISHSGWSSRAFKLYLQDEAALQLSNIILRGVQTGLLALVERALTAVKSFQPVDGSLLDFLAHSSSTNVSSSEHSCSPLMIACSNGDTKIVDVLLKNGASPSYKNKDDVTAVHVAYSKDNLKLVQKLVPLKIDGGLTQQATNLLQVTDKKGQTVFHYSSQFGAETLKWLLKNKALSANMLNKRTNTGLTPLLTACHHGNDAAVEVLVTVTRDQVNTAVCDENDQGALHLAVQHDSKSLVRLLLEKGSCPSDAQDSEGNTALHIAYKKSTFSVIDYLKQVDDGKIAKKMNKPNKAGKRPIQVEPDDIIPPEILKKGAKAVDLYFKALKKGKKRIPRCNFPILGQARVGKTSLYRHLVNLEFNPDQESTCGIDTTTVGTMSAPLVETREFGVKDWAEKDESTVKQHADQQFAEGVIGALPQDFLASSDAPTVTEAELEEELSKLVPEIEQILSTKKKRPTVSKVQPTQTKVQALQAQPTQPKQQPQAVEKTSDSSTPQVDTQQSVASSPTAEDPSTSNQSATSVRDAPKVSSRQVKLIDQALVAATASKERKEPVLELILNVLDFAGQEEYRPMHHCFLTRRAIYLLVFNLQEVILYIKQLPQQDVPNPFEELRYWLHSIHAHSFPAVSDKKEEKPHVLKNICLVGTHRGPLDDKCIKDLQMINKLIMDEIKDDKRCLSHLHFMGPKGDTVFLAVENSMKDREASGANALRKEINVMAENLPFLREEYPVIWYRFDTELTRLKENNSSSSSLVIPVEEVLKIATQCGITDPDEQDLALQFYHETGKIVCLKFLPTLFISEEEHTELKELVLLDPSWLIHVMKNLMELNFRSPIIDTVLINKLKETGVATSALLKEVWSEYLQEPKEQSFRQMCLMLQAEALIHPIRNIPKSALEQSPSESDPTLEAPPPRALPPTSETATTDEKVEYLIPGKLPPATEKLKKPDRGITFYFDFQRFLPREIYHRLVCLLLAVTQKKKSFDKPYLSQNMCRFQNIDGCTWRIQLEGDHHRLMITVFPSSKDTRTPTHHITTMHTEYLRKICQLSDLQGLKYVGGPLLNPCAQCGQTGVIRYVSYCEGSELESKSECPNDTCHEGYDVHRLLRTNQIKRDKNNTSDVGAVTSNTLSDEEDWAEICCYLNKLDKPQIVLLGGVLGLNINNLEKMQTLPLDMVRAWLRRQDKVTQKCGPQLTWNTLVKALRKIGQGGVADEIHKEKCTCT